VELSICLLEASVNTSTYAFCTGLHAVLVFTLYWSSRCTGPHGSCSGMETVTALAIRDVSVDRRRVKIAPEYEKGSLFCILFPLVNCFFLKGERGCKMGVPPAFLIPMQQGSLGAGRSVRVAGKSGVHHPALQSAKIRELPRGKVSALLHKKCSFQQ